MRFANVAVCNGQQVDLVINATSPYVSSRASIRNGCKQGGVYGVGVIHVTAGYSVDLEFQFVTTSGAPWVLSAFEFSFLDLDLLSTSRAVVGRQRRD